MIPSRLIKVLFNQVISDDVESIKISSNNELLKKKMSYDRQSEWVLVV